MNKWFYIASGIVAVLLGSLLWNISDKDRIDYNKDVKPILNKHCIGCHGGVKKAGNVSFLFEHEIFEPGKSGKTPVVKGNAHESEMIRRILSDDPDEKMPKEGQPLSDAEISILKQWINEGAQWDIHWAYVPVERPEVPAAKSFGNIFDLFSFNKKAWPVNPIDNFVLHTMKQNGLSPSPEADPAVLLRRVSLDLTGLPPTDKELNDFLRDQSAEAYEKVVDRLLSSPTYGERWAAMWLDLARYADTKGYESDGGRNIWRYRDYVIKSFNDNKPFDQFTLEQIAGDLLPPNKDGLPKEDQLVATSFHRNTMVNHEGGTSDEEFRVAAQIDRVNTTWEVWQGTTFACIQCHSHPYDPIPHEDYFKYMAYFNNTRDEDTPTESPVLRYYKGNDSLKVEQIRNWIVTHQPEQQDEVMRFIHIMEPRMNTHDLIQGDNSTLLNVSYYAGKDKGYAEIPPLTLTGMDNLVINFSTRAKNATATFSLDSLQGRILTKTIVPGRDTVLVLPIPETNGKRKMFVSFSSPNTPEDWIRINWLTLQKALPGKNQPGYQEIVGQYASLLTHNADGVPILWEGEGDYSRKTNVFIRGNWMVKGEEVQPGIPALLTNKDGGNPKNRLELAQWMTHRSNPLTARVIVNRFWEQLFGRGIVETLEDFGSQGIEPTHPALLDWLAVAFMEEDQWQVKSLLKRIAMSATYRQSSATTPEKTEKDPYNLYLARGPRVRLSAEQVRDQALAGSGLLSDKMYGPSVMPPQPDKIWQSPYSGEKWVLSEGDNKYRRGIYTYWKRTAPYPSMTTFDAPSREFCQSRRILTNTPLQALVTLNDPVYLEAAQHLAYQMKQKGNEPRQQLKEGYRLMTHQSIGEEKLRILLNIYQDALAGFQQSPTQVDSLLQYRNEKSPELAALMVSANVILNLDNVVTKE